MWRVAVPLLLSAFLATAPKPLNAQVCIPQDELQEENEEFTECISEPCEVDDDDVDLIVGCDLTRNDSIWHDAEAFGHCFARETVEVGCDIGSDCPGRCGRGCGSDGVGVYAIDCAEHDRCCRIHGGCLNPFDANCGDEFRDAARETAFLEDTCTDGCERILRTGTGDGSVRVQVDGYGSFGSAARGAGTSDAIFDPVGQFGPAGTTFESYVVFEETTPVSFSSPLFLTTGPAGNLSPVAMTRDGGVLTSTFTLNDGLSFRLAQSLVPTLTDDRRTGSKLLQTFEVTNRSDLTRMIILSRYLDGDLFFVGGFSNDRGGIRRGTPRTLFEFDQGDDPEDPSTFVGSQAFRGEDPSRDVVGFEIDRYPLLRSNLFTSGAEGLRNGIFFGETSADVNGDSFTDFNYDVSLAAANRLTLAAGESGIFETTTIFGSGEIGTEITPTAVRLSKTERLRDLITGPQSSASFATSALWMVLTYGSLGLCAGVTGGACAVVTTAATLDGVIFLAHVGLIVADPPSFEFRTVFAPRNYDPAVVEPDDRLTAEGAAVANEAFADLVSVYELVEAWRITLERYQGAVDAGDEGAAEQQLAALEDYILAASEALSDAKGSVGRLVAVLQRSFPSMALRVEDILAAQDDLRRNGFGVLQNEVLELLNVSEELESRVLEELLNREPAAFPTDPFALLEELPRLYGQASNITMCLDDVHCDDGDVCTTDSCTIGQGCTHSVIAGCVAEVNPGDLDADGDVDRDDLLILLSARSSLADEDDPRDLDGDGEITALDARKLTLLCTRPRCATE